MEDKENGQHSSEYDATVRAMISREDDLVNHRMGWQAAFNGLLFAALGFSWDKAEAKPLAIIFSFLGIATSVLNAIGLFGSGVAQRRLLLWWQGKRSAHYDGPGVMGSEPVDKKALSLYITPWFLLTIAFAIAWLVILVYILKYAKLH
jgi:hypothetical protein